MGHAILLSLTFLAGNALAADGTTSASPPPPGARSFELLDTNADGFLSRQEVAAIVR